MTRHGGTGPLRVGVGPRRFESCRQGGHPAPLRRRPARSAHRALPALDRRGLLSGGGYTESGDGYANAGVDVEGSALLALLVFGLGYYIVCEFATGMTLGKRMVGIRVVGEDGEQLTFGSAVVRNVLRLVDCLFFYLVGALFALTSPRGQRLGDRVGHTLVVRR
jgi:uncharacterized RDD family membrane protein YckC